MRHSGNKCMSDEKTVNRLEGSGLNLVISNQPDTWGLVVFIISDHDVVSPYLQ